MSFPQEITHLGGGVECSPACGTDDVCVRGQGCRRFHGRSSPISVLLSSSGGGGGGSDDQSPPSQSLLRAHRWALSAPTPLSLSDGPRAKSVTKVPSFENQTDPRIEEDCIASHWYMPCTCRICSKICSKMLHVHQKSSLHTDWEKES